MTKAIKIGFIGGGKMAQAMAKGFISAGLTRGEFLTASVHPSDQLSLNAFKNIGAKTLVENVPVVQNSDIIFLSTKPEVIPAVLPDIEPYSTNKLFISIAMGITLKQIEMSLPNAKIIRVMPNIAALIQESCSVFVRGTKATEEDAQITRQLLESIGTCNEIFEKHIDVVTGLSGSGPAYVLVMIEALKDGAVRMGLTSELAYKLACQTVIGAGKMVHMLDEHPAKLKDDITSPGGSTAAGLKCLESGGFRSAVAEAVEAATRRCQEVANNKITK